MRENNNTKENKSRHMEQEPVNEDRKPKANGRPMNNKKVKSKNRKAMKVVVSMLLIIIILCGAFLGYKIQKNGGGLSGFLATMLGEDEEENLQPIQVLIMGVSGVDNYKLSDSIMVASYNPKTQVASLMSIPRDTYVGKKNRKTASQNYIASYKINTVYRNGTNIPEALDRINDMTGLNLSNYVIIDTKALVKIVDAIGGVTFDVPINMDYDDDSQDLHIHLKAGEQTIDGPKAEQLLRFRHNNNGSTYSSEYGQQDLGRMKTQRAFITETLKQTLKPQNIFKIKQIMDIMSQNVTSNMDVSLLKKYVPYAVKFNADDLKTGVVPGDVEMCNGVSIYIANKTETEALVKELFGEEGTNSMPKETISNTTSNTTKTTNTTSSKSSKGNKTK